MKTFNHIIIFLNGLLWVWDSINIGRGFALLYKSQATLADVIEHGYNFYQERLSLQMNDHEEFMNNVIKLTPTSFEKDN